LPRCLVAKVRIRRERYGPIIELLPGCHKRVDSEGAPETVTLRGDVGLKIEPLGLGLESVHGVDVSRRALDEYRVRQARVIGLNVCVVLIFTVPPLRHRRVRVAVQGTEFQARS
jgi:hypothetical protein